ncbi:hypothetical protein DK021_08135 [Salmonella enterica subsp. enterica serovar Javiana]|nr:hypothetical protein [Salmonella enterica subsp. enterica serovar Javiana]EAP8472377.1 hypothetical protein [Salmonella enterica]ECE5830311.1 hypothetical protein [Salmonella enterica subsp. enterica]EAS4403864.1 hypothetical protein [Salmonella enterica]EAS7575918.1 hypothetical protein [Salmonella enterica]
MNIRYSLILFFCLIIILFLLVIKEKQNYNMNRFSEVRKGDVFATLSLQKEWFMSAQDVTF